LPVPRNFKTIKSLADHHFPPPRTEKISWPVSEPIKIEIPECELCVGEQNDFSEVDRMLADMNDDSNDARTRRMIQMTSMIIANLEKNIKIIRDATSEENDKISRADLLKLLQGFLNFTRTVESHIKETQCCR